jgi:hypothetical protein
MGVGWRSEGGATKGEAGGERKGGPNRKEERVRGVREEREGKDSALERHRCVDGDDSSDGSNGEGYACREGFSRSRVARDEGLLKWNKIRRCSDFVADPHLLTRSVCMRRGSICSKQEGKERTFKVP